MPPVPMMPILILSLGELAQAWLPMMSGAAAVIAEPVLRNERLVIPCGEVSLIVGDLLVADGWELLGTFTVRKY